MRAGHGGDQEAPHHQRRHHQHVPLRAGPVSRCRPTPCSFHALCVGTAPEPRHAPSVNVMTTRQHGDCRRCAARKCLPAMLADDVVPSCYLTCGKIAPEFEQLELSVGESTVAAAVTEATGAACSYLFDELSMTCWPLCLKANDACGLTVATSRTHPALGTCRGIHLLSWWQDTCHVSTLATREKRNGGACTVHCRM